MDESDDVWIKCCEWLQLISFPITSASISNVTTEQEFQTAIHDGSFLCNLLHHIDPQSINRKNIRENSSHSKDQSIHNAQLFLTSCEDYFMVLTCDLFEASTLYDCQQLRSILLALSSLSKTTRYADAMRARFDEVPVLELYEEFKEEEDDSHLYHLAGCYTSTTDSAMSDTYLSCNPMESSIGDTVYDTMMSQYLSNTLGWNNSAENLSTPAYTTISLTSSLDNSGLLSTVTGSNPIVAELLDKEAGFIQLLSELLELYKVKLVNLSSEHFKPIFCDDLFENMKNLHKDMRVQLNDGFVASKDEVENVCDVFLAAKTKIASVYTKYFTQIDASLAKLEQLLEENPLLRDIFEGIKKAAFEDSQCKSFDLCVVLHVPFQHVLRYRIFFERLCEKIIPSTVPGCRSRMLKNLEKTFEMTKDLNEHFNECKRNVETLKNLSSKFKEVSDSSDLAGDMKSFGKLLKEGQFSKVKVGKSFWGKTEIFIFQKAVAFLSKTKHTFLKLDESVILTNEKPNVITFKNKVDCRTVELPIKNPELFEEWESLIDELCERGVIVESNHHRCSLQNFDDVILCAMCERILKGSYSQGYQCLKCKLCFDDINCLKICKPCQSSATTSCNNIPALKNFFENGTLAETETKPAVPSISSQTGFSNIDLSSLSILILGGLDELSEYPWFCPIKNRRIAHKLCLSLPENTFLVRRSENDGHSAALMLKHKQKVQNIKISVRPETGICWLTKRVTFAGIPKLIDYFKMNSLSVCIPEVQTTLIFPFKEGLGKLKSVLDPIQYQALAFLKCRTEITIDNDCCELLPGEMVTIKRAEQTDLCSVIVEGFVERKSGPGIFHEFSLPSEILELI